MKRIIIIGAGPAGLSAAYELLKRARDKYEIVILEGSDRIGGICRTVRYKNLLMDLGGHRFFSNIDRVNEMWEELLPMQGLLSLDDRKLGRERVLKEGGPDPEKQDRVMLKRTCISHIYFNRSFFDYPISARILGQIGPVCAIKAFFSYLYSCIFRRQEDKLESFYINRFGKKLYSMFFEGYTEKLWGIHPSEISSDWGAQRIKGLSVTDVAKDMLSDMFAKGRKNAGTIMKNEFSYPKLGPGQMWEAAAEAVKEMGGMICTSCEVRNVIIEGGRITAVRICGPEGEKTVAGDIFLSSMPIKDLICSMNGVPEDIRAISEELPYRDFMTAGILCDRLELINNSDIPTLNDIIPDCWIYVQDTGIKMGRIQIYNNWSPYLTEDPEKTVWLGLEYFCREGDEYWRMDDKAFADFAADELVKMGVIRSREAVLDFHVERVRKAYPAYSGSYSEIGRVKEFADSLGNLYCIGRNGQHRYNNMDHSIMTAFEAADNILSGKETKENIWDVNTEKQYYEKKKPLVF